MCVLLLSDFSLESFKALQAGNRHGKDILLYYSKRGKGVFIMIMGCIDLPKGYGMRVSGVSTMRCYIPYARSGTVTNP